MNEARRGRELYARLALPLSAVHFIVKFLPDRLRNLLWSRLEDSGSILARALREAILQAQCESCGNLVDIKKAVVFVGRRSASIGARISIHQFSYIDANGGLSIGDDVSIAHGVTIMTTEHRFDKNDIAIRDQGTSSRPVAIADDVWIGAGAKVLAGVTIGTGSVVAAGAVVTRDVGPRSVVAGVPARQIRSR